MDWSLQRLELASIGGVQHLPATLAQPLAEGIGGAEVALPPALDALGQ